MKSFKQIMAGPPISGYTGSETTYDLVASEIKSRWGDDEVEKYDPHHNTLTFAKWLSLGYVVRKGERAIRSVTFVEVKDNNGNIVKRIKRNVFLFYYKQVEKNKTS